MLKMEKKKYYITTAIPYTSQKPHIGNSYEIVFTDAVTRYKRMQGYDVFFLTGTDEHGQKIEDCAKKAGVSPKEWVDGITGDIKRVYELLGIKYDKFIRTTDDYHEKAVQKIFKKLYEQGDIYKGEYEGWYCKPDESFWTETQLVDGKCPECGREVVKTKEEAYFLRLSKYQKQLEEYIESNPDFIYPEGRKKEMLNNFIKPGLQDLCVSRTSFKWGIPVDFDTKHVVYVWIDALSNYITALGFLGDDDSLYKKYWPADVHIIGKDVLRFHTIYWPIMLMALGEPLPKKVFGHPWLLFGTDKMSKSRGNVIYADDLVNVFGADAVRYYLLSEMPYTSDGSITYESLIEKYNSDLANTLGNLVSRTVAMIKKYSNGVINRSGVCEDVDGELKNTVTSAYSEAEKCLEEFRMSDCIEAIMNIARRCNKYIDETMPWALAKSEEKKDRLSEVLYNLAESIRICAILLSPVMPSACDKILDAIGSGCRDYETVKSFGHIENGTSVNDCGTLFARIDAEKFFASFAAPKEDENKTKSPAEPEMPQITIDDFMKTELRVAKILECEKVAGSDKLYKLNVTLGSEERQIVSGIAKCYRPDELIGKKVAVVKNLAPAKIRGEESRGMLLASSHKDEKGNDIINVIFLDDNAQIGDRIR
ncbi:MAG: methionine--tRNA ligase [Clostridia bacterium]|nr:methionine--tRNA ligase [Clostridia bacterium]MBQ6172083.1 methionine--tRNA ligase [Clostridia bacterium]